MLTDLATFLCEPMMMDERYRKMLENQLEREASSELQDEQPTIDVQCVNLAGEPLAFDSVPSQDQGTVLAVVPVSGTLSRHGFGGFVSSMGTKEIGSYLTQLDNDPAVGTIVLSINSPGGSVYGTRELSDIVYGIRVGAQTKIVSVVDPLMASAATYIGTAAESVFAISSGDVGSVGVIWAYENVAKMLENMGVEIEILREPENKARFTGVEPMTEEMRTFMKDRIRGMYEQFVTDMARNRGVSDKEVEKSFGAGEMMGSEEAVAAGLIDGIKDLDEVIAEAVQGMSEDRRAFSRARAQVKERELQLERLR